MSKCNSAWFIFRKLNFDSSAFLQNLRLTNQTIVFLGIELPGLCQSSVPHGSILIFKHLKISVILVSKCSSLTVAGILCISMLLRRVYCSWLLFAIFILRILSSSCYTLDWSFMFSSLSTSILNTHYTLVNYISNIFLDITLYLTQSTINIVEFLVNAIFLFFFFKLFISFFLLFFL